MTMRLRSALLGLLQLLLVASLGQKLLMDRDRLPRAWVRTVPVDPATPFRGRYVQLRLIVDTSARFPALGDSVHWVRLFVDSDRLVARLAPESQGLPIERIQVEGTAQVALREPVAFFIPEHARDPSRRATGEELWVEVSVPVHGPPRPLRLGTRSPGSESTPQPLPGP